ncbi:MAG: lipopolysaccharide heptosyltransferase I [Rhodoferax sp.]|nr:MAG: lipopolysaccharide heptosyltransferase I [Rhodoferax sp.]
MNILIVKLSSLGDVVHAMPAVQDIRRAFPQARIDWVVERGFAPLVLRCEGVQRVIPCDLRRWRKRPFAAQTRVEWTAFKAELQATAYDWVLDLQGLTKSALVAWLARTTPGGKKVALAHRTDGSGYEAPTRWVADVAVRMEPHVHAVHRARILSAQALGYSVPDSERFGLFARINTVQIAIENIANQKPLVALVHGTSRADKEWPVEHWVALGQRLLAQGCVVALAHGSAKEQATSTQIAAQIGQGATVWPAMDLAQVTDALGSCAGCIGVDSGLSHIATALDLPHVQIYNFDTAWRTGPSVHPGARQVAVFAQPQPGVDAVWSAWLGVQDKPRGTS